MNEYDYEIEEYIVYFENSENKNEQKIFHNEEAAVAFARKKYTEGNIVSIKQISHLVGWLEK